MDLIFAVPFWEARYLWVILVIIGFGMHLLPYDKLEKISNIFVKTPFVLKLFLFVALLQLVIQLQNQDVQPFIYFQF
jgi:hypothetical protein